MHVARPTHPLLDQQEAADHLRMTPRFLESRRSRGDGPVYIKVGNRVRYRLSDLDAWVEEQRRTSTSDLGNR
jgi:hypothetical protein